MRTFVWFGTKDPPTLGRHIVSLCLHLFSCKHARKGDHNEWLPTLITDDGKHFIVLNWWKEEAKEPLRRDLWHRIISVFRLNHFFLSCFPGFFHPSWNAFWFDLIQSPCVSFHFVMFHFASDDGEMELKSRLAGTDEENAICDREKDPTKLFRYFAMHKRGWWMRLGRIWIWISQGHTPVQTNTDSNGYK